jgi:hypothetical protein
VFFKTDADRAATQAAKARSDAAEAGSIAATGARNLGAAVVATLAEVTAPADDRKGKKHAQKVRAAAVKAAQKDRVVAGKAAAKAAKHGRRAAKLGRSAADHRAEEASSRLADLADVAKGSAGASAGKAAAAAAGAAGTAKVAASQLAGTAREQAVHARESIAERSGPLGESAKEKAGLGAALVAALAASARERAEHTRTRAVAGVDHGIDAAVPRAQESVAGVAPKVDHLRDVINEELLPKIQAMLGDLQVSKDRLLAEDEGLVAAVTGAPKAKQHRKGGTLITLGLLAAVGAGVAWWLSQKQKAPATDPWASQAGDDPWASRTPTSADPLEAAPVTPVVPVAEVTDVEPVVGKHASDADRPLGSIDTSETSSFPRMLESEEIDALATEEPTLAEEQTDGESPTAEIEAARESDDRSGGSSV